MSFGPAGRREVSGPGGPSTARMLRRILLARVAAAVVAGTVSAVLLSDCGWRPSGMVLTSFVVGVVASVVAGAIGFVRALRTVVGAMRSTTEVLDAIGRGEMDARAPVVGPTEARLIAVSLNRLADRMTALAAVDADRLWRDDLVRQVQHALADTLDGMMVLETASAVLGRSLAADRIVIRPASGDQLMRVTHQWCAAGVPQQDPEPVTGLAALDQLRARYGTGSIVLRDVAHAGMPADLLDRSLRSGVTAAVSAPLLHGGRTVGYLSVHMVSGPRVWRAVEIDLIESVVAEAATAMARVEAFAAQAEVVARLTAVDRERDAFVSNVSHELRTPLTSIAGYVELLADGAGGAVTERQTTMLAAVDRNVGRLRALLDELLALARMDSDARQPALVPMRVGPVLVEAVEAIRQLAEQKQITLGIDVEPTGGYVEGDHDQLERVFINLLSNAIKFTPAGGTVTAGARQAEGCAIVSVSDTGVGIPADEQRNLFTRFFRASTALATEIPGTGLGLAVVAAIVEHHAGRITVRSDVGKGSTFVVRLPLGGVYPVEDERTVPAGTAVTA